MGSIVLNLPPGYEGLPQARCSEHGSGVPPVRNDAPGKLTVTWTCQICEAEAGRSEARKTA